MIYIYIALGVLHVVPGILYIVLDNLYIVLGYFIYSSKKIIYSSGPVLAAHRQRGPRTHQGMCIETQDAISCWTNIRRLSRQHSCEAAHQHRLFSNRSSTLLGVSFWCSVTPIMWKQNDKVFSDTIAFFATMIWLGFSTLFHGNGTGWSTWKLDVLRDL